MSTNNNNGTPITTPSVGQIRKVSNWDIHAIDPEKKDENWAWDVFHSNKTDLRCAYGGYGYFAYDAQLIRQFGKGNQPIERYRVLFDPQDKENIYMGLNWEINSPIPRYRNIILAELNKIPINVTASAVDEMANTQRNNDKLKLKAAPIINQKLAELSKQAGYDQPVKSKISDGIMNVPSQQIMGQFQMDLQNDDELNIYFDNYYNQKVEVAEELAIKALMEYNDYTEVRKLENEDTVDFGLCSHRAYIDNYTGMPKFMYIEPYLVFTQRSKYKDYHDVNMWYYQPPATLIDVLEQFGNELTEEDVKGIWKSAAKRLNVNYENQSWYYWDWRRWDYGTLSKIEVDMYYFEVNSPNCLTYETSTTKYGKPKLKKRSNEYELPKDSDKKLKQYWAKCWYGGYVIEGVNGKVFKWGELFNQVRVKGNEQNAQSSLVMYRSSDKGLTEMMIPDADNFEVAYLKMQHAIVKSLPRGYSFNWDALVGIDMGTGGTLTPLELMKMYVQTGSTFHKSIDEMGDPILANANAPHMILENGLDPSVQYYLEIMNACKLNMAETIGLNPTTDATTPNPKLLVGVQQALQQSSSNARFFLLQGMQFVTESAAKYLSIQISDIAKNNKVTWERIKRMIGAEHAAIIESLDEVPLHDFAIRLRDEITDDQRQILDQKIAEAYAKGEISLSDWLNISFIKNLKQATALVDLRAKKREQTAMQAQSTQQQSAQQSAEQIAALKIQIEQISSKAKTDSAQISAFATIQSKNLENQNDIMKSLLTFQHKLDSIMAQKNADIETINVDAEHQKEIEKMKPKPKAAA